MSTMSSFFSIFIVAEVLFVLCCPVNICFSDQAADLHDSLLFQGQALSEARLVFVRQMDEWMDGFYSLHAFPGPVQKCMSFSSPQTQRPLTELRDTSFGWPSPEPRAAQVGSVIFLPRLRAWPPWLAISLS